MNSISSSSLERLEQRIAPAGLVTASFSHGLLTINALDGLDHEVTVVKTGTYTFRVDGNDTGIDSAGHDSKSFRGTLASVLIEGGSGADTFNLTNLSPLKGLTFHGNDGVDALSTSNLRTQTHALVDIELGAQTGSVDFSGNRTIIQGFLNIDLGGGGSATFHSALTTVSQDVTITGGSGKDSVSISGDTTDFKRKLNFAAGDEDDSFSSTGRSLIVGGFVSMDGGAGANQFSFAADHTTFGKALVAGLTDIKLGAGAGSLSFLGKSSTVLGDLAIDLGTGGGTAHLNSAVTNIRNNVQVTGGAGNDELEFEGEATIGKSLSFVGNGGDNSFTAGGALFSVKGATSMDGGSGAGSFDLHTVHVAMAGLSITGGVSNDRVSIMADGTIAGDLNVQLGLDGTGPSSVVLHSQAGLANGLRFGGNVTINIVGATVDVLNIANIQVAKNFQAQTGENVSTVDIAKLNGLGNFKLQTGAGADVVNIDNVNARDFYVDTQDGADELRIERNAAYTGASKILGTATILTGIGADQIRIGDASDPANLKVSFMGSMTLDAGDGANMRNDILASNFFTIAPSILATGGTLTQTEAV